MSITLSRREFLELSAGTSAMASMAPGMTMMEDELTAPVIGDLIQRGHECVLPGTGLTHRALMGGGQAIMIDPATGTLLGASDSRKDGMALGY